MRFFGLMLVLVACAGAPAPRAPVVPAPIWVLAPHPDDEALIGAQPIADALRAGRPVFVILMTNGDLGCGRDGLARQRETVAAMGELGVREDRIRFLGYPDGYLEALGAVPLGPLERRGENGRCIRDDRTYGARGEHAMEVHRARTGEHGRFTEASALDDLVGLLERDRPSDVYTSHPIDTHPDHASTYVLLRRALERARLDRIPTIHRAIVHAGECWPNGSTSSEPCPTGTITFGTPYPPLPEPLAGYRPNERIAVPDGGRAARRAIARYVSQLHTHVDGDWLGTFARADAIYWAETLTREGEVLVRTRSPGIPPGIAATLSPRMENDPDHPERQRLVLDGAHRAPFEIVFEARVPREESAARIHWLARAADHARGYAISVHHHEVELRRACDRSLDTFYLPDDGARGARHRFSVRIEPRPEEGVAELEVRRDGALLGLAIDPTAFLEGDLVLTRTRAGGELGAIQVIAR